MISSYLRLPATLLFALSVAPNTQAQTNPGAATAIGSTLRQGALSTSGVALLDGQGAGELLFRMSGVPSAPPSAWTTSLFGPASATHPVYTRDALLFGSGTPPPGAAQVRIRGFCSGNVVQPRVDFDGWLPPVSSLLWFALTATISGAQAEPAFSAFAGPGDHQSRLVSYYVEASSGISQGLVGNAVLEQDAEDLGFPASQTVDVGDFDYGMAFISENPVPVQGSLIDRLVNVRNKFYFTLFPVPPSVTVPWGAGGAPTVPDSRTIYVTTWDPGTLTWGRPLVAFPNLRSELVAGDEIDAIAVDHRKSQVIFSTTTGSSVASQMMVHSALTTVPKPLRDYDGTLATVKFGLRVDGDANGDPNDVTGLCGWDPEALSGQYSFHAGTPEYDPIGETEPMGISIVRSTVGDAETPVLRLEASGVQTNPNTINLVIFCGQTLSNPTDQPDFAPAGLGALGNGWQMLNWALVAPGETQGQLALLMSPDGAPGVGVRTARAYVGIHVMLNPFTGQWALGRRTIISKIEDLD